MPKNEYVYTRRKKIDNYNAKISHKLSTLNDIDFSR